MNFGSFTHNIVNSCKTILNAMVTIDNEWVQIDKWTDDFLDTEAGLISCSGFSCFPSSNNCTPLIFKYDQYFKKCLSKCDIETSKKVKKDTIGDLNNWDIIQKVKKIVSDPLIRGDCVVDGIRDIIEGSIELGAEKTISRLEDYLDMIQSELNDENKVKYGKFINKITEIIQRRIIETSILGEFVPSEKAQRHKIIIYTRTIWENAKSLYDDQKTDPFVELYAAYLSMVLAHELFHAFHYEIWSDENKLNNKRWLSKRNIQETKEVKEGLADFYSVCWSLDKNGMNSCHAREIVAESRYQGWKTHRYSKWPYASALEFYKEGIGRYDDYKNYYLHDVKMIDVLNISLSSWVDANKIMKK